MLEIQNQIRFKTAYKEPYMKILIIQWDVYCRVSNKVLCEHCWVVLGYWSVSLSKSSSLNFWDYVDYKDALHKSKHVAILLMVLFCPSVNLELLC